MRLDVAISLQFGHSRNKAQAFIKDGLASVNGCIILKPSFEIDGDEIIDLQSTKQLQWVSRSAGKLDGFLEELRIQHYELQITGANCLDVGSSTGGFTQVLLDRGARHVDAVDVGTDQLHQSLRNDKRITSHEQTDIRDFKRSNKYDIIVCDASFISLTLLLPSIISHADSKTHLILLWKPQFEVGKENLRKTGVPKNEKIIEFHQKKWEAFLTLHHLTIIAKSPSKVIGEAGNREWVYAIQRAG